MQLHHSMACESAEMGIPIDFLLKRISYFHSGYWHKVKVYLIISKIGTFEMGPRASLKCAHCVLVCTVQCDPIMSNGTLHFLPSEALTTKVSPKSTLRAKQISVKLFCSGDFNYLNPN